MAIVMVKWRHRGSFVYFFYYTLLDPSREWEINDWESVSLEDKSIELTPGGGRFNLGSQSGKA